MLIKYALSCIKGKPMKKLIYLSLLILSLLYGVSLSKENPIQVKVLLKSTQSWDTETLPQYPKGEPEITVLRIMIEAGAEVPMHKHPVISAGVLLRGELTILIDDSKTVKMKAGEALVETVNTWHWAKNEGSEVAELIVFYAGVKDGVLSIKKE